MSNNDRDRGYYSNIQFYPCSFRAEGINIGIILFSENFNYYRFKMTNSTKRIREVFKDLEYTDEQLESILDYIPDLISTNKEFIKTIDDFNLYLVDRMFNDIRILEPRSIIVTESNIDNELDSLYKELVVDN